MSKYLKRLIRTTLKHLKSVRKELKHAVFKDKNDWITSKCSKLNSTSNKGTKLFWDTVNKLSTGFSNLKGSNERSMKKPDGTNCKAIVFRNHFKEL